MCVYGVATLLPVWEDKKVDGLETPTMVARDRSVNVVLTDEMKSFQCCITRKQVAEIMHKFCGKISKYIGRCAVVRR